MQLRTLVSLVLILLLMSACSNQWRESEEISVTELVEELDRATQAVGVASAGTEAQQALALAENISTYTYFAYGPGQLGPAGSVASLIDFSAFGFSAGFFDWTYLDEAVVFFFDSYASGERQFGLVVGAKLFDGSEMEYRGMLGTGSVSDGEMVVEVSGPNGSLILRSFDVEGEELSTVIQIRVFEPTPSGEVYIGKFATLRGFAL